MRNLDTEIPRYRLIIEAQYRAEVDEKLIKEYLTDLTKELGMRPTSEVFIFSPNKGGNPLHHGLNGFIGWVESGCHIYTWDQRRFLTVDIYCSKKIPTNKALEVTRKAFDVMTMVHEEISPYD